MDGLSFSKSEWSLSQGALAKFLACLDPDPHRAGEKYEGLRLMLMKLFDWRGARFPDECADETINRVFARSTRVRTFARSLLPYRARRYLGS